MLKLHKIAGNSMMPLLRPGQIVVVRYYRVKIREGSVILFQHEGLNKIKRVQTIKNNTEIYVEGDNEVFSTDSRHYGPISTKMITGTLIWPRI